MSEAGSISSFHTADSTNADGNSSVADSQSTGRSTLPQSSLHTFRTANGTIEVQASVDEFETAVEAGRTLSSSTTQSTRRNLGSSASSTSHSDPNRSNAALRMRSLSYAITESMKPDKRIGQRPSFAQGIRMLILSSWLNVLLIFIPISWALYFSKFKAPIVFSCLYLAVIPLGNLIGILTDEITLRIGTAFGIWVATTMGNSVEFISAIVAVRNCELCVVQSSLVGAMLSNLLLILGLCFFAGGTRFSEQGFSPGIAQINSSLLVLAVIAVLLPAAFHFSVNGQLTDPDQGQAILRMSHGAALVLLSLYFNFVLFQLFSHVQLYSDERSPDTFQNSFGEQTSNTRDPESTLYEEEEEEVPFLSIWLAIGFLVFVIALTVATVEFLVNTIGELTATGGISREWIGLILLPLLSGNTAERIKSVTISVKDKINLCIKTAVGSTIQIAILIIPLVICIAWIMGKPLTLLFDPFECVALFLSVLTLNYILADGKTNWFEGMILIHLYFLVAVAFWFYPRSDPSGALLQC
ncbi:unnamed protein product [Somion occarium]|uniref:Vacuolar calcium ion transporter n=1 Tax=Somion occarium TaxID=3059160 RepID=A0ABP1DKE3_9APHY